MNTNSTKLAVAGSLLAAVVIAGGCGDLNIGPVPDIDFPKAAIKFAHDSVALSPSTATAIGYHLHQEGAEISEETGRLEGGTEVRLDGLLDDYSTAGVQKQVAFYRSYRDRLNDAENPIPRDAMRTRDNWADYGVMENRIARKLYLLENEKPHERDPSFYVTLLGRALYVPVLREYASADERFDHVISRLQATPDFLAAAKSNLTAVSEVQAAAGRQGAQGLIALVNETIAGEVPAGKKAAYDAAAAPAVAALEDFASVVGGLSGGDWRLGRALYDQKLEAFAGGGNSEQLAGDLETAFEATYGELIEAARPAHRDIYGRQRAPNDATMVREVLDVLGDDNRLRAPADFVGRVAEDIASATAFVKDEDLVDVLSTAEIRTVPTPAYLKPLHPVSAFLASPLLSPEQGSIAWVTTGSSDWSRARTTSQLREYNKFRLKVVGIDATARFIRAAANAASELELWRKLLRNVDANPGYASGWPLYVNDSAVGLGYESSNEFKVISLKQKLETIARGLLDVRMHAMSMSEDEASDMLRQRVFLDASQAAVVIGEVQLRPGDFAVAYFGAQEWQRVRQFYQQATTDFSLSAFHGKAMLVGPMPVDELAFLITDGKKIQ